MDDPTFLKANMNYFAHPNISRSDLVLYKQKGARTYEAVKITKTLVNDEDESIPLIIGGLTHLEVLEPDIESKVVIIPESALNNGVKRNRKGEKNWTEFESANPGPKLKQEEYESAMGAARAIRKSICGLLNHPSALKEHEIYWTHEATGLPLKAKLDLLLTDYNGQCLIPDLKTCADIDRFAEWDIQKRLLWIQHAHYRAAVKASHERTSRTVLTSMPIQWNEPTFWFCVVEKDGIYRTAHVELEQDAIEEADRRYEALLVELAARYETTEKMPHGNWVEARELGAIRVSKRACFGWEPRE